VNHDEGIAVAKGHHPILYVSPLHSNHYQVADMEVSKAEELTLLKFEDRDSREPVTFGSSVCLQTAEGHFFTFKGNGEMRVEKNQKYEEGSQIIAKLTKWQIVDARKVSSKEKVTPFNDICLRSPYSNFFQVEDIGGEDLISANGPEITEASMFKIIKANIPHLPDWLFKRPHLNHNSITASYSSFLDQAVLRKQEDRPKNLGSFPLDI
jgi:hypothetical protein